MTLELHVWGPAFGLPSIDAECIAAIAYLHRTLPAKRWTLVPDYDPSISSQGEFPILVNGSVTISGFAAIVSHLKCLDPDSYDLDARSTDHQRSIKTALSSFLQSTATPLIDLSLYVSSENYNSTTCSSYTAILPWYLNYSIPPTRRNLARSRTAHLGLNSLDVNTTDNNESLGLGNDFEAAKRSAGIPADASTSQPNVLRMGRLKGIQGLLSSPIYAARFKLDSLTNELLEPLSEMLGLKNYILEGDQPSSLDCLAFGYLALMLYPSVPQAWLKEGIEKRFPLVVNYMSRMREELIGGEESRPTDVWTLTPGKMEEIKVQAELRRLDLRLPWRPRAQQPPYAPFTTLIRETLSNVPLLSSYLRPTTRTQSDLSIARKQASSSLPSRTTVNVLYAVSAITAATFATLAILHRRSPREGELIFWAMRPAARLGEAEEILSVLAGGFPGGIDTLF